MVIKILGEGCDKCHKVYENTLLALKELNIKAEVLKIEDFKEIIMYGIMSTPAFMLDETVKSTGRILSTKDIIKIIQKHQEA